MWNNIEQDARFYFVHSFYVEPQDESIVAATCDYGLDFLYSPASRQLVCNAVPPRKKSYCWFAVTKKLCGMEYLIFQDASINKAELISALFLRECFSLLLHIDLCLKLKRFLYLLFKIN